MQKSVPIQPRTSPLLKFARSPSESGQTSAVARHADLLGLGDGGHGRLLVLHVLLRGLADLLDAGRGLLVVVLLEPVGELHLEALELRVEELDVRLEPKIF